MNTQNTIVTIGSESYLLPSSFSKQQAFELLTFLTGCKKVDASGNYIPNAETEYGDSVCVVNAKPVEVELKLTAAPLMSREEYREAKAKGKAIYDAAHAPARPELVEVGNF